MDLNFDGKISIEELKYWFRRGRSRNSFIKKLYILGKRFDMITMSFLEIVEKNLTMAPETFTNNRVVFEAIFGDVRENYPVTIKFGFGVCPSKCVNKEAP
mmetsp:Transcript_23552/g.11342  ORF Transcript_23552/g.11342 Transcript_23552/m.11342 type:complete len:100 (-) Transcript_23552:773-1072(-)